MRNTSFLGYSVSLDKNMCLPNLSQHNNFLFMRPVPSHYADIANLLGNSRKRDGKSAALSRFSAKLEMISKLIRYTIPFA
jgi:hypothetical protein